MYRLLFIATTTLLRVSCALLWSADDYSVSGFDKYGINEEMYAGYMPIHRDRNDEGNFFFWMTMQRPAKRKTGEEKLLIWLNGGPGCSSMLGMHYENGPFNLMDWNETKTLQYNQYSWSEEAHVIYVEQPIRTGFSLAAAGAAKTRSEIQVARDFRGFLSNLIQTFPFLENMPVYISGESYAGSYIPWIADHILRKQTNGDYGAEKFKHINLQGAAIGNGAIDQMIQNPSYAEFMYVNGFIPLSAKQYFDRKWTECIESAQYAGRPLDRGTFDHCNMMGEVLNAAGRPNEYNTATFQSYDHLWVRLSAYMNDPEIQRMIHVRGRQIPGVNFQPEERNMLLTADGEFAPRMWMQCNDNINSAMRRDHPVSAVPALAYITKYIRVLLYSGSTDLNCNTIGTIHTLEANTWSGGRSWGEAERSLMRFGPEVAGEFHVLGNLSFLIVRNSGHLVPMDKPDVSLDMMKRFLDDESFADIPLLSDEYYKSLKVHTARDSSFFDDDVAPPSDDDDDDIPSYSTVHDANYDYDGNSIEKSSVEETVPPAYWVRDSIDDSINGVRSNASKAAGLSIGILLFVILTMGLYYSYIKRSSVRIQEGSVDDSYSSSQGYLGVVPNIEEEKIKLLSAEENRLKTYV